MKKETYQPISCHFYDELEALAVRKRLCKILYQLPDGTSNEVEDIIINFQTKDKAEYLITQSGLQIRLDYLIRVDGKELKGYC